MRCPISPPKLFCKYVFRILFERSLHLVHHDVLGFPIPSVSCEKRKFLRRKKRRFMAEFRDPEVYESEQLDTRASNWKLLNTRSQVFKRLLSRQSRCYSNFLALETVGK